jgi:3-hydroxyacyl-[acyl-carrier-protein] dehydratase
MMAQATSFIVLLLNQDPFSMKMDVALLGINEARFRKPIFPDMELKIVTKTLKVRGPMITSECKLYHNDVLMSEATVLASLKMT